MGHRHNAQVLHPRPILDRFPTYFLHLAPPRQSGLPGVAVGRIISQFLRLRRSPFDHSQR